MTVDILKDPQHVWCAWLVPLLVVSLTNSVRHAYPFLCFINVKKTVEPVLQVFHVATPENLDLHNTAYLRRVAPRKPNPPVKYIFF